MRVLLFAPLFFSLVNSAWCYDIHDGHLHYNQDLWQLMPPEDALRQLDYSGIDRAIISSTPAEGTLRLYELAPERIIPFLRPYLTPRDAMVWHSTPSMLEYVREQLDSGKFMGFGEFHIFEPKDLTPLAGQIIQLVADKALPVNAHVDPVTLMRMLEMQPEMTLIWAHCGFNYPVQEIALLFEDHPNLYCDLSLREEMLENDLLLPAWKALLERHPGRFLVGMDTWKAQRWARLPEYTEETRHWLDQLEPHAANLIARGNIDRMFPPR